MALNAPTIAHAQKRPKEVHPTEVQTAPTNGKLAIYSCPVGASIYLNNRLKGKYQPNSKLSQPIDLKPGRYQLKIEHSDYLTFTKEVVIEPGQLATLPVDMKPQFGYLELELSQLSSATVLKINDIETSTHNILDPIKNVLRMKMQARKYQISIIEPGYRVYSNDIEITGGETLKLSITLEHLAAKLRLRTQSAARVYIDNQPQGIVPLSGILDLNLSLTGKVPILIEHNLFRIYQGEVELIPGAEIELPITLEPKVTSTEFSDNFEGSLNLWQAPPEWRAEGGFLHVRGDKTLGMPKERYYCDNEVIFGIRLLDARGAAWIVRAIDERNYYLFYLNGPNGPAPNKFQVFLCRDGVIDFNAPLQPPLPIFSSLNVNQDYRIIIKIKGNTIEHEISNSATGEEQSLGYFEDAKEIFKCGNFGFATINREDFLIHGFSIRPVTK